jgi:amidophosphoribosyltransferase
MVHLLKSKEVNADVSIIFQSIEGLHEAIPDHPGDWYFTGDYPTPGGSHIVNEAFINFVKKEYNGAV